jgi:ribose transport system permease protein
LTGATGTRGAGGRSAARAGGFARSVPGLLADQGLLLVIVVFGLVMSQLSDVFLTERNLINILYQSTILAVFAVGMTFVILTAGIDLSVGAVAAVASVLSIGVVVKNGWPPAAGIALALAIGSGVGLFNGLVATKIGITPLIGTLAMLSVATGFAFAYTDGSNIVPVPHVYHAVGVAKVGNFPAMIFFALGLAARLAGIRTDRVLIACYTISGLCAAIAGLMLTARLESGSPRSGSGMELTVIAAVVIGGTSLFGGVGGIRGTLYGVLLITMVTNAINLLGVPSAYDQLVQGAVIFTAAALDVYRNRFAERRLSRRARVVSGPAADASPARRGPDGTP